LILVRGSDRLTATCWAGFGAADPFVASETGAEDEFLAAGAMVTDVPPVAAAVAS
jgi:hypothetical protein